MTKRLPLSKNELDELQELGSVSLEQLNIALQNSETTDEEVEDLYDELERRGISIVETTSARAPRKQKSTPRISKKPSDLDEVLESLADLETLMQKWDEVGEIGPDEIADEEEEERSIEDGLGLFMNRVGHVPLLDAEEESTLLRQVQSGSEAEQHAARQQLMEANQRLVLSLAQRYSGRTTLSVEDLMQEGTLGLAKAIDNFGPDRKGRLSSYATWWIRRSIRKAMENHTRSVRLPGEYYATIRKLQTLQAELAQELGHNPSLDELAQAADMPLVKVEEALRAGRQPLSLEQPVGEDNELGESLTDDGTFDGDANFSKEELREELELALATLPNTERIVVEKRFGMGDYEDNGAMTLEDVAREMGFSNEHTRRLEVRALRKLRRRSKNAAFGELLE
jgi:RNA polymerase primary sigma factor